MPRKSSIIDLKNTEEKLKKPRLSKKDKTVTISATEAVISDTIVTAISLAATTAVASPVATSVANTDTIVKPKRGRKSKSELMALLNNTNTNTHNQHNTRNKPKPKLCTIKE